MPKEFTPSSSADSKPPIPNTPDNGPSPIVPQGGSIFQSMHLVFRQDSITVRFTRTLFLFLSFFLSIGIIFILIGLFDEEKAFSDLLVFGIIWTSLFLLIILHHITKRKFPLFDLIDGLFYPKGFARDGSGIVFKQFDHLEITRKECWSPQTIRFHSYELNIVLKDGSRYNVMDHGHDKLLLSDAKRLADRLSIPLINANTAETIPQEQTDINPHKAQLPISTTILLIMIGLVFFCVGSIDLYSTCIRPLCDWFSSANWTPTPARVVSSQLSRDSFLKSGEPLYGIDIQYVYNINDTTYTGSRYDFFRSEKKSTNIGVEKMREIVSSMPPEKEITCLVNPKNPHDSVISRTIPWIYLLQMATQPTFPVIGFIILLFIIRTLRRQKAQSQLAPHPASQ